MDIFEFLSKFERKFRLLGTNQEKAEKLWEEFLPDHVKIKTETYKQKFKELKDCLVKKYGSLQYILENTLRLIETQKSKTTTSASSRLALFSKILLYLSKLESLKASVGVSQWETTVYGVPSMNRLINVLSTLEWEKMAVNLTEAGEDTDDVQGERAYGVYKATVQMFVNTLTRAAGKEKASPINVIVNSNPPPPEQKSEGKPTPPQKRVQQKKKKKVQPPPPSKKEGGFCKGKILPSFWSQTFFARL